MDINRYVSAIWRWWWMILLATALAGAAGLWTSQQEPRVYRTSTTVQVGQIFSAANPDGQDFTVSQQLAQFYAQSVRRQPVLQASIDSLGLYGSWNALAGQVDAWAPPGTQTVVITVVDLDPKRARAIADEVARQLILFSPTPKPGDLDAQRQFLGQQSTALSAQIGNTEKQLAALEASLATEDSALGIRDLQAQISATEDKLANLRSTYLKTLDMERGSSTNYLSVVEPAFLPESPVAPAARQSLLIAAFAGFLLAAAAALLMEHLDGRIRNPRDVARTLALPVIGSVGRASSGRAADRRLVALTEPHSQIADAYRLLRANVGFSSGGSEHQLLLIASPEFGDGKTLAAANLAVCFAQAGQRTILVDADLRQPSIHSLFGTGAGAGLSSLLARSLDQAETAERSEASGRGVTRALTTVNPASSIPSLLKRTRVSRLWVLPAGESTWSSAELLASPAMHELLEGLGALADVVILNAAPVLRQPDAAVLAATGAAVVLALEAGMSRERDALRAKEALAMAHAEFVGVMLYGVPEGPLARVSRALSRARAVVGPSSPPDGMRSLAPLRNGLAAALACRMRQVRNGAIRRRQADVISRK